MKSGSCWMIGILRLLNIKLRCMCLISYNLNNVNFVLNFIFMCIIDIKIVYKELFVLCIIIKNE